MKRLLTSAAAVLLAVPLLAAEQKTWDPPKTAQQDSPLVAAAKAANRLGKKPAFVITNETLKTMTNAHFTTTQNTHVPSVPKPEPTAEMVAREKAQKARDYAEAQAAPKRKAQQEQRTRAERAYGDHEDAMGLDGDPAEVEGDLERQKNGAAQPQSQPPQPAPAPRPPQER